MLGRFGFEVDIATNGAAAWRALTGEIYDLLITNNDMPELTGVTWLRKVRSAHLTLPVIMTAWVTPAAKIARAPWLQPATYLLKPFTFPELISEVKRVLGGAVGTKAGTQLLPHRIKQGLQRILVVDDDSEQLDSSVAVLVGFGYEVETASDGAEGWAAIQANDYDLVVTDNKMPRMTGLEMIEKVRSSARVVPVLMATRHLPAFEFSLKPWLIPEGQLRRPVSGEVLLRAVQTVLHEGAIPNTSMGPPL